MRTSRAILSLLCLFFGATGLLAGCGGGGARPGPSDPPSHDVVHVRLEGQLEVVNMALLERAIRTAQAQDASVLLVEIDTPGGGVARAVEIARGLRQAEDDGLRTVAWVHPAATSAGALVTLACRRVHMSSSATIGAALPVMPSPGGMQAVPGEAGEKVRSYLRGEFRAHAEAHGRPKVLAEAMVDPDIEAREVRIDGERRVISGTQWNDFTQRGEQPELLRTLVRKGELLSLTANEALSLGMADGIADDVPGVLSREGMDGASVVSLERSRSESLLAKLNLIAPALLAVGLMLGYVELKSPGFGIAGSLGLACLGLLLFGRYMVGLAEVPHLVMVFLGAVLIVVELFVLPGTIWIGLGGTVCVMIGLWLSEFGPGFSLTNPYDQSRALDAAFELGVVAVCAMVGMWMLSHFLPDTPVLRALVQAPTPEGTADYAGGLPESGRPDPGIAKAGAQGKALTALRPVGKVRLDGAPDAEYEAWAEGPALDAGDRVRVVAVRAGRLAVESAAEEETA